MAASGLLTAEVRLHGEDVHVSYQGPVGGAWLDAAYWMPGGVPQDGGEVFYHVTVNGGGGDSFVSINGHMVDISSLYILNYGGVDVTDAGLLNVTGNTVIARDSVLTVKSLTADSQVTLNTLEDSGGHRWSGGSFFLFAEEGFTSTVRFNGAEFFTNAGGIYLNGAGTNVQDLSGNDLLNGWLMRNESTGSLQIVNRTFFTSPTFTNEGYIEAAGSGRIFVGLSDNIVDGALVNFSGDPDRPAEWVVRHGGVIRFDQNPDGIGTIGENVSVRFVGAGGHFETAEGNNALSEVSRIDGRLMVQQGAQFSIGANVMVGSTGQIQILSEFDEGDTDPPDSVLEITGNLDSIFNHELQSGSYFISSNHAAGASVLRVGGNAEIHVIGAAASVSLDGANTHFLNNEDQNALAGLRHIDGLFSISNGRDFTTQGDLVNNGELRILSTSRMFVTGDYIQTPNGRLVLGARGNDTVGSLYLNGPIVLSGEIGGSGEVGGEVTAEGGVNPGFSPGRLDFNGSLTFTDTTQTYIELGGLDQGITYDFINVHGAPGTWVLDGNLNVSFWGGFEHSITALDRFTVGLSSGDMTGFFDNIASGSRLMTSDGIGTFLVEYGTGSGNAITLSDFQPTVVPEPGSAVLFIVAASMFCAVRRRRA